MNSITCFKALTALKDHQLWEWSITLLEIGTTLLVKYLLFNVRLKLPWKNAILSKTLVLQSQALLKH